jgi:RNA polymerase sigma-70 factor, ECF subfamily
MSGDDHILELVARGDVRAGATEALRTLGPSILRYLRSVLRDEADAADAFSDFAEALWSGLPGFRAEASLRTWAYRIAWTCARDLREEAWRRRGRRLTTSEASVIAAEIRTSSAAAYEEKRQGLEKLRAGLSVEEQSLIALRIDQQLSWEEIGAILEEPAPRLTKRFERLKARLAKMAKEQGLLK